MAEPFDLLVPHSRMVRRVLLVAWVLLDGVVWAGYLGVRMTTQAVSGWVSVGVLVLAGLVWLLGGYR